MQTPRCAALAVVAVFVLSSGFSPAPAAAQAADAPSRWWVAGGLGGGGSEQADGSAAMLELVHQRGFIISPSAA